MKYLLLLLLALLVGCRAQVLRHQKGGATTQTLGDAIVELSPAFAVPDAVGKQSIVPGSSQTLVQPENPAGTSKQELVETTTKTNLDGTVTTTVKRATTEIGGSQDLADILSEYASSDHFKNLLMAIALAVAAYCFRIEWPTITGFLVIGAGVTAVYGFWAFLGTIAASVIVYITFYIAKAKLQSPLL